MTFQQKNLILWLFTNNIQHDFSNYSSVILIAVLSKTEEKHENIQWLHNKTTNSNRKMQIMNSEKKP